MAENSTRNFRAAFLHVGKLPPAGGPRRTDFLVQSGYNALHKSASYYGAVLTCMGVDFLGDIGRLHRYGDLKRGDRRASMQIEQRLKSTGDKYASLWRSSVYQRLLLGVPVGPDLQLSEANARKALGYAVEAYNYLEDTDDADAIHMFVHEVAAFVRVYFGCPIDHDNNGIYWRSCALDLMHYRWGVSVGYTSRRVCSICGENLDTCPHLIDQEYAVTINDDENGDCSFCGTESCDHIAGQTILIMPGPMPDQMDVDHLAMTPRPRDPLARLTGIALASAEEMSDFLGVDPSDLPLTCDRCLQPCPGFLELPESFTAPMPNLTE